MSWESKQAQQSRHKKKSSCTVWFFAGALLGMFAAGLIWLKLDTNVDHSAKPGKAQPAKVAKAEAPKPNFQFYDILPEMEVVIPQEELAAPKKATPHEAPKATDDTKPAAAPERYVLQLGSFRRTEDAENLKARVALFGVASEIQQVTINNRDTYHRVRSRPYGRDEANTLFARLKQNGLSPMILKIGN